MFGSRSIEIKLQLQSRMSFIIFLSTNHNHNLLFSEECYFHIKKKHNLNIKQIKKKVIKIVDGKRESVITIFIEWILF